MDDACMHGWMDGVYLIDFFVCFHFYNTIVQTVLLLKMS